MDQQTRREEIMPFDCDKLKPRCKAACCCPFPIDAEIFERNRHKIVRPIVQEEHFEDFIVDENSMKDPASAKRGPLILALGEFDKEVGSHRCPFLTYDLKCNIYDERPATCREFGKESHILLTCCFQDKDGRERSRQEMRSLDRQLRKYGEIINKKLRVLQ